MIFIFPQPGTITKLASLPVGLCNFACDQGGGYIHIHGGLESNSVISSTYYYYNLSTGVWTTGNSSTYTTAWGRGAYYNNGSYTGFWSEGGTVNGTGTNANSKQGTLFRIGQSNMAYTTSYPSSAYVDDGLFSTDPTLAPNGPLYGCGGYNNSVTIAEAYSVSTQNGSWAAIASMPYSLNGHSSGVYNGNLYVGGGYSNTTNTNQTALNEYNKTNNTWTTVSNAPTATAWVGGCVYKNWFIIAKTTTGNLALMLCNLNTYAWKTKTLSFSNRYGLQIVADYVNHGIHIMGGTTNTSVGSAGWNSSTKITDHYFVNEAWIDS
jgi:hypothetical protein